MVTKMNRRAATRAITDICSQIRHGGQSLIRMIMTLDTYTSSYRVPVEFPGEVGRDREVPIGIEMSPRRSA